MVITSSKLHQESGTAYVHGLLRDGHTFADVVLLVIAKGGERCTFDDARRHNILLLRRAHAYHSRSRITR